MTVSVKSVSRRLLRLGFIGVLLVLVAGLIAPFINAARYTGRIREALEASLGRKVDFHAGHFALFSGLGFSLDAVTIHEDPRFGIEPFAYVPTLQARLRIDKLLVGRIQFSSLRLVEPSVNLVKRSDRAWNIVELVERLRPPRGVSLNVFPALEIAGGRVDFKFGTRKTTLYIADSNISVYPERSGKLYIQFSGSPARTDRAGNGFGHLHGTANWYFARTPGENQLEADVALDPSDLSEMTTLVEGYDMGVHGTASANASIDGPATALRVSGELRLQNVHRWDLLPGAGQEWRVAYRGNIDLLARSFSLEALPWHAAAPTPVALEMRVNDFLAQPAWSVLARLNKAPAENLLPLCKRMGLPVPENLSLGGTVDGAIGYSNRSGLAGGIIINDVVASLPSAPPLRAAVASAKISSDAIHFDPAVVQTPFGGTLRAGGDYRLSTRRMIASLNVDGFPVDALSRSITPWFSTPSALAMLKKGDLTGQLIYDADDGTQPAVWSGRVDFANATLVPPGLAVPLTHSDGRITFDHSAFNLQHFSTTLGETTIRGDYSYSALLKHPERLHLRLSSADLSHIEAALEPTLRAQGLLARLRFGHRAIPAWLATRNLEVDVSADEFSVSGVGLGALRSHLVWQGTTVQFNSVQLNRPEGVLSARGTLNLAAYSPTYRFAAGVSGFGWRGGILNAEGTFETSGTGSETLRNLRSSGTFSGENLSLSTEDAFSKLSGLFEFSFDNGWPDLRLSNIQASEGEEAWVGEAASQSDGKLIFELENADGQRRVISSVDPETPAVSSALTNRAGPREGAVLRLR
jgi:hypothetical protein